MTSKDGKTELVDGAWEPCEMCDSYWCRVHKMHASECPCPGIEVWLEAGRWPYDFSPPKSKKA